MDILKILFHFFIFPIIYASDVCQFSWCGGSIDNVLIRFPFQLQGEKQDSYCGYPGFKLTCTSDNQTVLKLPYAGEFYVRNINYLRQQILVYDPDDCLPKRLLSLNLSGSPFAAIFPRNYTFLSCPYQIQNTEESQFFPIDCVSNSTNFILSIPSVNLTNSLPESCYVIRNLSVPSVAWEGLYDANFRYDLGEDLRLTWYTPDCRNCESQGGLCGFDSRNSCEQIGCVSDYQTGLSQNSPRVMRIIALSIVGPVLISAIGMTCFVFYKHRRGGITLRIAAAQSSAPTAISQQPAIATMGLNESTIESYQKLVLGESRRVPGPNDGCCSICLSEYNSKETVRCIPQCKHCFHAECIDEWLRMNSTCPLCRNSPSPSPVHVDNP